VTTNVPPESVSLSQIAGTTLGSIFIQDTIERTNLYNYVVVVEDTVFTVLDGNHSGFAGVTYPAGTTLSGQFTRVQLASGKVIAYASGYDYEFAGVTLGSAAFEDVGDFPTRETIILVLEPLDADASAGTKKAVVPYFPYDIKDITLNLAVDTAPTGSSLIADLNVDGASTLSTKISIDDGEVSSETASVPYVLSSTQIAEGSTLSVDIDQVGATTPGQNPVLTIEGVRS
jgi:hypothetical protein